MSKFQSIQGGKTDDIQIIPGLCRVVCLLSDTPGVGSKILINDRDISNHCAEVYIMQKAGESPICHLVIRPDELMVETNCPVELEPVA